MQDKEPLQANSSRMPVIYDAVRRIAVFGTLLYIFVLTTYLVVRAFENGLYPGIRSSASALLPVIIVSFLFIFHKEVLELLGMVPAVMAFLLSMIAGIVLMVVIRFFAHTSGIPVAELVLSGTFSILVFSSGSLKEKQVLSYYYGIISGFLLYIILFGFPSLK